MPRPWPPAAATKAAELAAPVGLPVVVDAEQPYDDAEALLAAATHLAFPREGLHSLVGHDDVATALEEAHRRYGGWIAVTDGARGVSFTSGEAAGHADALSVAAVDTLGAGDVWHGAFALALAEGRDEGAAAVFANAAAALKCANGAGWGAIPTRQDVDAALNRAP